MGKENNEGYGLTVWYCVTAALLLAGLVMQIIPESTIMVFGNPKGAPYISRFSYFDFTHIGYGNCLFFLSGCLTLAALVLSAVNARKHNARLGLACSLVASLSFLIAGAGSALFNSLSYFNVLCWATLIVLFIAALSSFVPYIIMMKK